MEGIIPWRNENNEVKTKTKEEPGVKTRKNVWDFNGIGQEGSQRRGKRMEFDLVTLHLVFKSTDSLEHC